MSLLQRVYADMRKTGCLWVGFAALFMLQSWIFPVYGQWTYLGLDARSVGDLKIFWDTIYAGTDNGIYKHPLLSADTTWLPAGLQGKVIRTLLVKDYNELWAVRNLWNTKDSELVYKTTDAGRNWSVVFTSHVSGSGNPTDNLFDVMDSPVSSQDTLYFIDVGVAALYRTTNGGNTWDRIHDISWRYRFIKIDPVFSNHLWFGGEGMIFNPILFESSDYGSTWNAIDFGNIFAGDNACHTLALHSYDLKTWYVPGEGKVVTTTNGGSAWSVILENSFYNFDMVVSPARHHILYDIGGPYLFRSMDTGVHWDTLANTGFDTSFHQFTDLEVAHTNGVDHLILGGYYGVYRYDNIVTDVGQNPSRQPVEFRLAQNFPNPFNLSTTIHFELPKESFVTLRVYNIFGQEVGTLVNEDKSPGKYNVIFDASGFPSGVYFYQLMTATPSPRSGKWFTSVKKMLLVK